MTEMVSILKEILDVLKDINSKSLQKNMSKYILDQNINDKSDNWFNNYCLNLNNYDINIKDILNLNLHNSELKHKYMEIQNKFHNDYIYNHLILHKENGIKEIVKRTYNSSLSDIENWLYAEKIYDYPFNNNKDDIITYLKSLLVPIKMTHDGIIESGSVRDSYCIIVDKQPYMWLCYKGNQPRWHNANDKLHDELNSLERLNCYDDICYTSEEVGTIKISLEHNKVVSYIDLINNKYKNITFNNIKYILYKLNIDISDIEQIESYWTKTHTYSVVLLEFIKKNIIARLFKSFDNKRQCYITEHFKKSTTGKKLISDNSWINNYGLNKYLITDHDMDAKDPVLIREKKDREAKQLKIKYTQRRNDIELRRIRRENAKANGGVRDGYCKNDCGLKIWGKSKLNNCRKCDEYEIDDNYEYEMFSTKYGYMECYNPVSTTTILVDRYLENGSDYANVECCTYFNELNSVCAVPGCGPSVCDCHMLKDCISIHYCEYVNNRVIKKFIGNTIIYSPIRNGGKPRYFNIIDDIERDYEYKIISTNKYTGHFNSDPKDWIPGWKTYVEHNDNYEDDDYDDEDYDYSDYYILKMEVNKGINGHIIGYWDMKNVIDYKRMRDTGPDYYSECYPDALSIYFIETIDDKEVKKCIGNKPNWIKYGEVLKVGV
jgi:hypothetical protein